MNCHPEIPEQGLTWLSNSEVPLRRDRLRKLPVAHVQPQDAQLVDRGINAVPADGIYFFRVGEEGFITQPPNTHTVNSFMYRAKFANPDYDLFELTAEMDFDVLG